MRQRHTHQLTTVRLKFCQDKIRKMNKAKVQLSIGLITNELESPWI